MLSQQDKARVRKDFIEWSGGYGASEVPPQDVVAFARGYGMKAEEVETYLTEWAEGPA